jgi:hypothetical protein
MVLGATMRDINRIVTAEETAVRIVYRVGGTMTLANSYKQRAAECVRMAEDSRNPDDKAKFLKMAEAWLRLSEKAEEREPPADS